MIRTLFKIICISLCYFILSCKDKKFSLPKKLYIDEYGYLKIDSIEKNYLASLGNFTEPFKTLDNIFIRQKYEKNEILKTKFKIYDNSPTFRVLTYDEINGKISHIGFYNEKRHNINVVEEPFRYNDGTIAPPHINDLESKIKIEEVLRKDIYKPENSDSIDKTFDNLKDALIKKYGEYNYYFKGFFTVPNNDSYPITYVWYVDGVKIQLSKSSPRWCEAPARTFLVFGTSATLAPA